MADELNISSGGREEKYQSLVPQIEALLEDEEDLMANCANICAALRQTFGFLWVGFYFVRTSDNSDELVLGPFQGDIACTRIALGKGVCGKCWEDEKTIIVDDVDAFPGHIVCSALSKSEIVVPILKNGMVRSVLDVDSDELSDFNEVDQKYLEQIADILANKIH